MPYSRISFRTTLSDFAKYSVMWSITWSLQRLSCVRSQYVVVPVDNITSNLPVWPSIQSKVHFCLSFVRRAVLDLWPLNGISKSHDLLHLSWEPVYQIWTFCDSPFLPHDAVHSTDCAVVRCLSVCSSICPSVCSSQASILSKRLNISPSSFSPSGSQTILVFPYQMVWQSSNRNPLTEASNAGGIWKISIFDQYLTLFQKWHKIEPQLLWNANGKPYPSFRMVLSDLEWHLTQFSRSWYYSTSNNLKMVQGRAYLQWPTNTK